MSLVFILSFLLFVGIRTFETARDLPTEIVFSYYENRNLAQRPEPTRESVLNGSYFSALDTYLKEHTSDRDEVLEAETKMNLNILKRPVVNDVVIGDGILLPYNEYEAVDADKIAAAADAVTANLKAHTEQVKGYGGSFYYVAIPCQYVFYEDEYPSYLNNREEYTAASTEALFSRLRDAGVSYIDMREVFDSLGNRPEFSSNIDNHYGLVGAYETYRAIVERINADTGYGLDVLEDGEFVLEEMPNRYMGSRLRKLFGLWDTTEHLFKLHPNDPPAYRRWDNGTERNPQVYYHSWDEAEDVLYGTYMGGDVPNTVIDTEREELPDILIYGDSFSNAVECIIWNSFGRMESLDFRYYGDKTLEQYIEETKPDVVVCIRDYESILNVQNNGQ